MPSPLELSAPTIPTRGYEDTYNEFDRIYSPELLASLAALTLAVAQEAAPGIEPDDIWVSGFSGGYSTEELEATDAAKLARPASQFDPAHMESLEEWGFDGDDSSEHNVIGRDVTLLRQKILAIGREMAGLDAEGILAPSQRNQAREQIRQINDQIAALKAVQAESALPIYYVTTLAGITNSNGEDNPLSYIGDVPGEGFLVVYDGRAVRSDSRLRVSTKSEDQIRIAGRGADIMRHALAVVRLVYSSDET